MKHDASDPTGGASTADDAEEIARDLLTLAAALLAAPHTRALLIEAAEALRALAALARAKMRDDL